MLTLDCLVSHLGHSLEGILPLCREAYGVFYSPSRLGKPFQGFSPCEIQWSSSWISTRDVGSISYDGIYWTTGTSTILCVCAYFLCEYWYMGRVFVNRLADWSLIPCRVIPKNQKMVHDKVKVVQFRKRSIVLPYTSV